MPGYTTSKMETVVECQGHNVRALLMVFLKIDRDVMPPFRFAKRALSSLAMCPTYSMVALDAFYHPKMETCGVGC